MLRQVKKPRGKWERLPAEQHCWGDTLFLPSTRSFAVAVLLLFGISFNSNLSQSWFVILHENWLLFFFYFKGSVAAWLLSSRCSPCTARAVCSSVLQLLFIYSLPWMQWLSAQHREGWEGEPAKPTGFKGEFRQNYSHVQGLLPGARGAFVAVNRLGSSVWHRHSCWGLGPSGCTRHSLGQAPAALGGWGTAEHTLLLAALEREVVFGLGMTLFPLSFCSILSGFGYKHPGWTAWPWSALSLAPCCSGHPGESMSFGIWVIPGWGESSVHPFKMLQLSWWRYGPQGEMPHLLKFSQFRSHIAFGMSQSYLCAAVGN